jgi:apolipoprotein N-acyltransferase
MLVLFKVTPNRIGISIISFLLILEIGTIFYLATQISKEDSNIMIPILLAGVIFFSLKYLLWNIYGEEVVVINSKSLSYSYNYGVVKTSIKSIQSKSIRISYEITHSIDEQLFGHLVFRGNNPDNNLPYILHETAINIEEKVLQDTIEKIEHFLILQNDKLFFSSN